jgi:hypothetical protein
MLKSGTSIRFTATEVSELAELGIDVADAKSADDFAAALGPWLHALAQMRPALFDRITHEIAAKGVRMPAPRRREH